MEQLKHLAFRDRPRALREIGDLARALRPEVIHHFDLLVSGSAEPETALHYFTRLQEAQAAAFARLTGDVFELRCALSIFTHSWYLSEEILRRPEWLETLLAQDDLERLWTAEQMREVIQEWKKAVCPSC